MGPFRGTSGRLNEWEGFWFACHEIRVQFPLELVAEKWVGEACEVGASADASRYYVWLYVDRFELFLRFKANNRLMSQNMVHDRAKAVSRVIVSNGVFERFADCDAESSWMILVLG